MHKQKVKLSADVHVWSILKLVIVSSFSFEYVNEL